MSCLHVVIGIVLLASSVRADSWSQDYSCKEDNYSKVLRFNLGDEQTGRFYLYYELEGFQQNHFRFSGSWSAGQMRGQHVDRPSECRPLVSAKDRADLLHFTADDDSATLFPCGLMPNFFFNDTYQLQEWNWTDKGISWPKEIGNLFRTPEPVLPGISEVRTLDFLSGEMTNEHFIVWMRTAKAGTFRKLYARMTDDSLGPDVRVNVRCNFPFKWFTGQRRVVIMRMGGFGGKNTFLGVLNLVLFVLCAVFAFVFKAECCSCVKDDERPHSLPGHQRPTKSKAGPGNKAAKKKHDESEDVKLTRDIEDCKP
jgi:hypothetical protein